MRTLHTSAHKDLGSGNSSRWPEVMGGHGCIIYERKQDRLEPDVKAFPCQTRNPDYGKVTIITASILLLYE